MSTLATNSTSPRGEWPHRAAKFAHRASYSARAAERRTRARARVRARTRVEADARSLRADPLAAPATTHVRRVGRSAAFLALSLALHLSLSLWMLFGARARIEPEREMIRIEIAQPPPPPEPAPEPEPEPEPIAKTTPVAPKPAVRRPEPAPPPPAATPEPPPEAEQPPPRIIGLSLDSTVEGGAGPSFAIGNALDGTTARKAVDAKEVPPVGVASPAAQAEAAAPNRTATRIPTIGVKFTQPKNKRPDDRPEYPTTLRSQGIEGDVTVLASISALGKVTSVKIIGQVPYPEFAEAARNFVLAQEYEPATRDDVPVATTITFTIRFRIEDE